MKISLLGNSASKSFKALQRILSHEGYQIIITGSMPATDQAIESFHQVRDGIIAAEIIVCDISIFEDPLSYQLPLALEYRRPVVLMVPANAPNLGDILALKDRNLTITTYRDDKELEMELLDFLNRIKNSMDAKLFMNIPPSMNKYLDWVAVHTEHSKSDVVRNAVENVAEKDERYQKFLKSFD